MFILANELHCIKFSDPSHGWLSVKRRYTGGVDISPYSYQKGQTVYLEEDSDASNWIRDIQALGYIVFIEHRILNRSSKIRSYDPFYRSLKDTLNVVAPYNVRNGVAL